MPLAQLAPLAAAPALMVVASLCERRWGARVAGALAAAPVTVLVGVVVVSGDLGFESGRTLAVSTSAAVLPQVVLALTFLRSSVTVHRWQALARATIAYVVAAATLFEGRSLLPHGPALFLSISLGFVGAVVARWLLGDDEPAVHATESPLSPGVLLALRAGIALVAATTIFVVSHAVGPTVGGVVGAYPMFSVTLACLIYGSGGAPALRNVLRGLIFALPAYLSFGVTYWALAPTLRESWALLAAVLVCSMVYVFFRIGPTAEAST